MASSASQHAQITSDEGLRNLISGLTAQRIYEAFDAVSKWVLVFGIVLAVIAFAWAGITFLTARGDQQRLATAKKAATWAVWGTVLIVVARSIVVIIGKFFS